MLHPYLICKPEVFRGIFDIFSLFFVAIVVFKEEDKAMNGTIRVRILENISLEVVLNLR